MQRYKQLKEALDAINEARDTLALALKQSDYETQKSSLLNVQADLYVVERVFQAQSNVADSLHEMKSFNVKRR